MAFRDDRDAMAARLAALEREIADLQQQLAERDAAVAAAEKRAQKLEARLASDGRAGLELERELQTLRKELARKSGKAEPIIIPAPAPEAPPAAREEFTGNPIDEAERLLQTGILFHRVGKRKEAAAAFKRGLELMPGHVALLRAQKRYS